MKVDGMKGFSFPARTIRPEERLSGSGFARVIGSVDQRFYSTEAARAAGYESRPLPRAMLGFVNTLDEDDLLETLGIEYGKTMAAGIEVEYGVVATEQAVLVGQTRVEDAYEREGKDGVQRQFIVLETSFTTEADELVSRTKITFIERSS